MHLKPCVTRNTYPITTYNFNYFRHNNTRINRNVRRIISDYAVQLAFRQGSATDISTIKMQNHRQYIYKTCAALHCCFKHIRQYKPGTTIRFMPIKHCSVVWATSSPGFHSNALGPEVKPMQVRGRGQIASTSDAKWLRTGAGQ